MSRVKLTISYDGTRYHGWQIQDNAITVQETLQNALGELFSSPVSVSGCSRTDAGVHAKNFVCHFDLPHPFPLHKLPLALNAFLPGDIAGVSAEEASDDFHARFSCKGKQYVYRLYNENLRNPFEEHRAGFWPTPLNADRMNEFAKEFVGWHNFKGFMASGSQVLDTVREIYSFDVKRDGSVVEFYVSGNGFLYNMVRIMVGTLIYADLGKLECSIDQILQSEDRTLAGITMPPQGLYLNEVYY